MIHRHASAPDAGEDKDDTINDFHAALGDLHLLWVANLGGQQFASAALVQAADLSLAGGSQVPACLAWCPRLQQAGKEPHMGLTVFTVTCPFGISREETRLGNMASSQPNFRADNGR